MEELIGQYTLFLNKKNVASNTLKAYISDIRFFFEYLSEQKMDGDLSALTETNALAYIIFLQKSKLSQSTISRKIASIKGFGTFLYKNKIISKNIFEDVKLPPVSNIKEPEILSIEEIERLIDSMSLDEPLSQRDKAIIELIYATGINATEIINMKVTNISFEYKYVQAGAGKRIIPMGNKVNEHLKIYMENARALLIGENNTDVLFVNYAGKPLTRQGLWKIIRQRSKNADINKDVTPKMLRQSFAVHMAYGGADVISLKEMMGHNSISATQVYMKKNSMRLNEVYAKAHPRY